MNSTGKIDWVAARLDYERGMSQAEVSRRYGVSRRSVQKHAERDGWTQDVRAAIDRAVRQKVIGISPSDDAVRRERLIADESAKRAEVLKRHRLEWDFLRSFTSAAMAKAATVDGGRMRIAASGDLQDSMREMRWAKIAAEVLRVRQECERTAYGLDEAGEDDPEEMTIEQAAIRVMQLFNAAGIAPPPVTFAPDEGGATG